ncbi:MAG: anthranilate synthase component I family protein [Kiloniellales bacterium]|nr:anthranilate synthase component I family protein [Kiloniellales bacterium]
MIELDTSTSHIHVPNLDIFSAYILAIQKLSKDDVFLLESCAGPEVDCRESILGVGALATIEIYRDRILITAPRLLQNAIETCVNEQLGEQRVEGGRGKIYSGDEAWRVLRSINGMFSRSQNDEEFNFGFLACLSYDAACLIERLPYRIRGPEFPLVFLRLFQSFLVVAKSGSVRVSVTRSDIFPEPTIDIERELLPKFAIADRGDIAPNFNVKFSTTKDDYLSKVQVALNHIRLGDIYQVQIGHEVKVASSMEPLTLYRRLRELNPSPYMFLCKVAGCELIGASPENYVRLDAKGVSMRPIAGTIGKKTKQEHQQLVHALTSSPKECAEHTMLVDLCRNDIARVSKTDTLNVESLMSVEEFSHLFHLVSTVTGEMAFGCDVIDLVKATFPAGTMTGAPKIRAMEIIEDLEVSRREAYAGAVGLIGPGDFANMALCIRMASYRDQIYSLRACAGIVADSVPENEWQETIVKMRAVFKALTDEELVA